ncbi:MAG: MFS transporter [Burkholderiales bacterium]|nr:MFS transporter [Burkholderiales bacterium]
MSEPAPFSLRSIAVPAFGPSLLFGIGEGAILPVVALSVRNLGGSVALAALVVTLIGIGSLVSNLPASVLTTRYGERWAIVGASVWCALAMAICMLVPHLAAFTLGVFMIGMASAVFNLARQSYLTEAVPFHYRARALSTLGGVMRIGLFIGPFLGAAVIPFFGLAGAYGVGVIALVLSAGLAVGMPELPGERPAAALAAAAAAAASDVAHRPPTIRAVSSSHARVFLTVGIGVILVSAVRASRQAVVPLWADHLGLDAATTSLIYGLASGLDMLVFYPAGKVMDRKGRAWVALPSMICMGAGLLCLPLSHSATTLLIAALILGFGNGIGSGMIMTLGADYSPVVGRAHFLGIWRLLADLGSTGGPALLSAATALFSLATGIFCTGLIAIVAAAVLGYWIPRTARHPAG